MDTFHKRIRGVLAVLLILAVAVTVFQITGCTPKTSVPEFTPPPFEEAAISGVPEKLDVALMYGVLELKEGFVVSLCGAPVVDENGVADVYFTSDSNNTVWVRLLVLSEDGRQLGATGILRPGEYVKSVQLGENSDVGTNVILKIISYEPDTYYSMGTAAINAVLGKR